MANYLKKLTDDSFKELIKDVTKEYERREIEEEDEDEDCIYSRHISEFTKEALDIATDPYKLRGIATGYRDLDKFLCGLGKGELTAISADTSVGKTLFTLNLINNAYKTSPGKFTTLYVSLDTAIVNVCARFYSMHFDDENPIYFYNNTIGASLEKVRKAIDHRKKESGLDLIVIDMLNSLVRSAANQANEMASVTLKLRELALEMDVHIIILCHVTKEASKNHTGEVPHYSSIKDSSAVA
jgi:replicative DNA helicase